MKISLREAQRRVYIQDSNRRKNEIWREENRLRVEALERNARRAAWSASDEDYKNGCRSPNEDSRYCPVCGPKIHQEMHLYGDCDCEVSGQYF